MTNNSIHTPNINISHFIVSLRMLCEKPMHAPSFRFNNNHGKKADFYPMTLSLFNLLYDWLKTC